MDGEAKTVIDMSARELETAIRERKEALEAKEAAEAAQEKMSKDMELVKSRLDALNEEAAKTARKEVEDKLREKLDKAAKAKADAEADLKSTRETLAALRAKTETLEKQVKVSDSKELATAAICFESIQETFHKMLSCIQKLALAGNVEKHDNLVEALSGLLKDLEERLPTKLAVA